MTPTCFLCAHVEVCIIHSQVTELLKKHAGVLSKMEPIADSRQWIDVGVRAGKALAVSCTQYLIL